MHHCFRKQTTTTTYHHTVQVTMYAFSICAIIALEKTPLPPPPHSASYNITATTTCASRVSAPVGPRKRPPVQVTVATTCASRVSVLVGHRKRPPVQVTVAPGQHMHHSHHHVPESKCAQWLKKKTTRASYSRSEPTPLPLECTLQQANVTCLRACH